MFGRMFGRGKDESDQAVCAECGRTLLAGEWTQKVVDADGEEVLICSLCGQTHALSGAEPVAASPTPANNGRVRETREDVRDPLAEARDPRTESDAFWKALKDKDAELERLKEQLARVEAENRELAGRLARASGAPVPAEPLIPSAGPESAAAAIAVAPTGDSSEPGERTWGETPAEFAAELATPRDEAADMPPVETPTIEPQREVPAVALEDTQPIPAISDAVMMETEDAQSPSTEAEPDGGPETTLTPEPQTTPAEAASAEAAVSSIAAETAALVAQAPAEPEASDPSAPAAEPAAPAPTAADVEAETASMTLLQRGVDLLNVSRVPHKIAETNEQLGLPSVHVGFDDRTTAVTFMWSMGWYRFHVDSESGDIRMVDRGYDELTDLRPNAGVRADGTVQLDPAQISRAAQRTQPEPQPAAHSAAPEAAPAAAEPEPPSVAAQKPPEILSKSLLGQRSDDEAASWEQTQARDFDWDR